jgi:hypothetical protein
MENQLQTLLNDSAHNDLSASLQGGSSAKGMAEFLVLRDRYLNLYGEPADPVTRQRLEVLLSQAVRDRLYSAGKFSDLARADEGMLIVPGYITGFANRSVPDEISKRIKNQLSPDVRDQLSNAR